MHDGAQMLVYAIFDGLTGASVASGTARENPYVALDATVRVQNMSKFFI